MSKRILVIEDTENNRRILNDLLTNAGFEVLEAVDGEKRSCNGSGEPT